MMATGNFTISSSFTDLSEQPPAKRFRAISDEEVQEIANFATPKSTLLKRKWAYSVYEKWSVERGYKNNLTHLGTEVMDSRLAKFICEARNQKGESYPAKTLYELITNLQGYLRDKSVDVSFFDKTSLNFKHLRDALDGMMRKTSAEGNNRPGTCIRS